MSEPTMSLRMTDDRGDRLRRVMQATGENTKASAVTRAMKKATSNYSMPWTTRAITPT